MLENLDIVQVILIGLGIVIVASVFLKSDEERDAVMASVSNVVRGYGDSEFKDLVSSIR